MIRMSGMLATILNCPTYRLIALGSFASLAACGQSPRRSRDLEMSQAGRTNSVDAGKAGSVAAATAGQSGSAAAAGCKPATNAKPVVKGGNAPDGNTGDGSAANGCSASIARARARGAVAG